MITSQILMITKILLVALVFLAGCTTTSVKGPPFCPPDRPSLETVSLEDQRSLHQANPEALAALSKNDVRLKTYISTVEEMAQEYNDTLGLGDCSLE